MKLKVAAHTTAMRGDSTRVDDDGGDRVGGVVEAVDEVEPERDRDDDDRGRTSAIRQACFRTMASTMSEMSSMRVERSSIASTMSFHRTTSTSP